jgi:two-component system, LytTR family, response regulator
MQQISGLEFAKLVPMNVKIIFTTAFKEYAIEAYKVNAFDYLVKPILYEDFMQTCQKVFDHYMQDDTYNPIKRDGFVVVKNESRYTRIPFENILFIESVKDYVKFHMADGRNIMTLGNLKRLEEKLPREKFRRVHRSFIANLTNFDYIQNMKVIYGKLAVPISDTNKDDVVKFVEEHGIN